MGHVLWYRLMIPREVQTQMKNLNVHVELDTGVILDNLLAIMFFKSKISFFEAQKIVF